MRYFVRNTALLAAALMSAVAIPASAQIRITEVAPWSSGNSPVGADWFELTNRGMSAVDINGWKMDDGGQRLPPRWRCLA